MSSAYAYRLNDGSSNTPSLIALPLFSAILHQNNSRSTLLRASAIIIQITSIRQFWLKPPSFRCGATLPKNDVERTLLVKKCQQTAFVRMTSQRSIDLYDYIRQAMITTDIHLLIVVSLCKKPDWQFPFVLKRIPYPWSISCGMLLGDANEQFGAE